jgi:thiol-disulfide isomerase/thioredoxin
MSPRIPILSPVGPGGGKRVAVAYTRTMATNEQGRPAGKSKRLLIGLAFAVFAALVAVAAWQAIEADRRLKALAESARPAPSPAPGVASPLQPPPPAPPLPLGQLLLTGKAIDAPVVDLATLDGKRFTLAASRGQVVFLNFWATWCPPCGKEMPSMVRLGQELARKYPGKFKMVAVSVDEEPGLVKQFFKQPAQGGRLPSDLTVAMDPHGQKATKQVYCAGRGACDDDLKFPESYIVDKAGRIAAFVIGDLDWSDPEARALLEKLINS